MSARLTRGRAAPEQIFLNQGRASNAGQRRCRSSMMKGCTGPPAGWPSSRWGWPAGKSRCSWSSRTAPRRGHRATAARLAASDSSAAPAMAGRCAPVRAGCAHQHIGEQPAGMAERELRGIEAGAVFLMHRAAQEPPGRGQHGRGVEAKQEPDAEQQAPVEHGARGQIGAKARERGRGQGRAAEHDAAVADPGQAAAAAAGRRAWSPRHRRQGSGHRPVPAGRAPP